jgi:hypothetical protein
MGNPDIANAFLISLLTQTVLPTLSVVLVYLAVKYKKSLSVYLLLLGVVIVTLVSLIQFGDIDFAYERSTTVSIAFSCISVVVSIIILAARKLRARH